MRSKYFKLHELVSEQVLEKYGNTAWDFFDPRAIAVLDWIKEKTGSTVIVNNWYWGGILDERGFRANLDEIVFKKTTAEILYCSAHMRGMAFDLNVAGYTIAQLIEFLEEHKDEIPYNIRIEEDNVNRLHFDVVDKGVKIEYF